jgi:hypothetical protein
LSIVVKILIFAMLSHCLFVKSPWIPISFFIRIKRTMQIHLKSISFHRNQHVSTCFPIFWGRIPRPKVQTLSRCRPRCPFSRLALPPGPKGQEYHHDHLQLLMFYLWKDGDSPVRYVK